MTTSEQSTTKLVKPVWKVVEEWEEEEWTPRTCSPNCLAVAVDSSAEAVAVSFLPLSHRAS